METNLFTEIESKTKVRFLIDVDGDDNNVFAHFPEEKFNNCLDLCYAHIGQHSGVSRNYVFACRPATIDEYLPLKIELESEGYNLLVLNGK